MLQPVPTCLVIADISGYTGYLSAVELDHAQDVLADLIGTVVRSLRPFRLAKLEGDAAFVFAPAERLDGQLLLDAIDGTYLAYRRRVRDITMATTCECNACLRIPSLDLKLLAHHGPVATQRMAGRDELVGASVIVAHRLLKNDIVERTGITAYAALTDACVTAAGLDPGSLGLRRHVQSYEHLGEVGLWVADLGAAWERAQATHLAPLADREVMGRLAFDLPVPVPVAWDFAVSPARRAVWQGVERVDQDLAAGRRGSGTVNHCVHGPTAVVEEVLDWEPMERFVIRSQMPMPGAPRITYEWRFEPTTADECRMTVSVARPRAARDRAWVAAALPDLAGMFEQGAVVLQAQLAALSADAVGTTAVPAEPDLPVAAGRFIREPVHGR